MLSSARFTASGVCQRPTDRLLKSRGFHTYTLAPQNYCSCLTVDTQRCKTEALPPVTSSLSASSNEQMWNCETALYIIFSLCFSSYSSHLALRVHVQEPAEVTGSSLFNQQTNEESNSTKASFSSEENSQHMEHSKNPKPVCHVATLPAVFAFFSELTLQRKLKNSSIS